MKIAMWGQNFKGKYSGGRIHAWMMAMAFGANNCEVDFYTNVSPVFAKDFNNYRSSKNVNVKVNKLFLFFPSTKYDLIVIVPHLSSKKSFIYDRFLFYPMARLFKKRSSCSMWYIDFESPNWINEVVEGIRPLNRYKYSNQILPCVDMIVSTTVIGMCYARKYYSQYNLSLKFTQLYLAINSIAANEVKVSIKEDKVIYFGRFSEAHKNPFTIVNIIKSLPFGYKLLIIGSKANVENDLLKNMLTEAANNKIEIEFKHRISEIEKYREFASSKLLIYSSLFEGYGLPPIESQYVGTPVICSDLPVLREVNSKAVFVNFEDLVELKDSIDLVLQMKYDDGELRNSIASFAKFENYTANLDKITKSFFEL